ncbi:hypothetical protein [Acinetobacter sp. WCHAc060025]|uniref:DUF6630 family protein n=1 Tax=Acinetobacter sp. WCHAc060025 TaxID=2518625 RepID=UPI001023F28F|nr:hypothetical protein [Acinetobacter sp. WCHAc060025]RZG76336.1 hypothetical protein EXE09_08805 [Acinetobacter sp. WCHAc060025]
MTLKIKIPLELIELLSEIPQSIHGQYTENQKIITLSHQHGGIHLEFLIHVLNDHREFQLHAVLSIDNFKQFEIINLQGCSDNFKKSENRYLEAMFNMAIRVLKQHSHNLVPIKNQNPKWKNTLQLFLKFACVGQTHLLSDFISKNFLKIKYMKLEERTWFCLQALREQNLAISIDWRDIEDLPELIKSILEEIHYKYNVSFQALENFDIENDDETIFIENLKNQLIHIGLHLLSIETHSDDYFFLLCIEDEYSKLIQLCDKLNLEIS